MTLGKFCGMFWHVHHDMLAEWSGDIRERIRYVKEEKPTGEVSTRLRLMKKVKGELPAEYMEACQKCGEARQKWKSELEAIHKKDCGCKEWNGTKVVFK